MYVQVHTHKCTGVVIYYYTCGRDLMVRLDICAMHALCKDFVYMYRCGVCMCMYVCICVCMYVCMYVHVIRI